MMVNASYFNKKLQVQNQIPIIILIQGWWLMLVMFPNSYQIPMISHCIPIVFPYVQDIFPLSPIMFSIYELWTSTILVESP